MHIHIDINKSSKKTAVLCPSSLSQAIAADCVYISLYTSMCRVYIGWREPAKEFGSQTRAPCRVGRIMEWWSHNVRPRVTKDRQRHSGIHRLMRRSMHAVYQPLVLTATAAATVAATSAACRNCTWQCYMCMGMLAVAGSKADARHRFPAVSATALIRYGWPFWADQLHYSPAHTHKHTHTHTQLTYTHTQTCVHTCTV